MITFREFLAEVIPSAKLSASSDKEKMRLRLARSFKDELQNMTKYFGKATARNFRAKYNAFVNAFPTEAKAIDAQRGDGVGPGELIAYFVFDNITIGGGSSPIDLFLDGDAFAEVKAGDSARGGIQDFKLDTENSASSKQLMRDLTDLNDTYKETTGEDLPDWNGPGEASTGALRAWEKVEGDALEKIEDRWVDSVKSAYIRNKNFMLVNRRNLRVHYFGRLGIEMIDLLRTTRGQPKAAVAP